jgi:pimeloyl-ACP methyl ester carboxylesterase
MTLKKTFFCCFVFLLVGVFTGFGFPYCSIQKDEIVLQDKSHFEPDVLITDWSAADQVLLKKMRSLFFEAGGGTLNPKDDVYRRAIRDYGARECMLLTEDNLRISSLFFERKHAPVNVIYITGYFHDETPPKEWVAPFAALFPNFNILSFDWRGFGSSEGRKGKWTSNEFGPDAYRDIQAAVHFLKGNKEHGKKPIILVGFCFGAAMALYATIKAQEEGNELADALVLDSVFDTFHNMVDNAFLAEDRWYRRPLMCPWLIKLFLDNHLRGDIFALKPIDMIEKISLPCLFSHFTYDPFATLEQGIKVFEKKKDGDKMFVQSDEGRHVRVHSKVPSQYRDAFYDFLRKSRLLNEQDFITLTSADLNFEICDKIEAEVRA